MLFVFPVFATDRRRPEPRHGGPILLPRYISNRSSLNEIHGHMAKVGHGLPKESRGLAMPDPSMPCRWATPEKASGPFQWWPHHRRPAAVFYPFGHPTLYISVEFTDQHIVDLLFLSSHVMTNVTCSWLWALVPRVDEAIACFAA
jgi:hypothetical protein